MSNPKIKVVERNSIPESDIERLFEIMLHAYAETEKEIWGENYSRMSRSEFDQLIDQGQIIGAWIDGVPVGSIFTAPLYESTWSLGLFSVDFDFQGQGIGRKLMQAAEEMASTNGATQMELEILRPENEELEIKKVLHNWYEGMGYGLFLSQSFADRKPSKADKALMLIQPSVFDCYRKKL